MSVQTEFTSFLNEPASAQTASLEEELAAFDTFGTTTQVGEAALQPGWSGANLPVYLNEFWTARQRQANSLHEVSYRACFKPQLPRFFIERLTLPGEVIHDPFMGRGTTLIETALMGRVPSGCDVNPLSRALVQPRLNPPGLDEVARRLDEIAELLDLIRLTHIFGFYLARLDIRQESTVHTEVVTELLSHLGIEPNYAGLNEQQRLQLLGELMLPAYKAPE